MPSRALLDAVSRYLEPRRLATCEIRTVPPRYRRIAVDAVLHLACGVDGARVQARAREILDGYLDPLTGGADRLGWPFGRAVYRGEILALLAGVPGVERVTSLRFRVGGNSRPRCDNVPLCANELPRAGRHRLRIETETPSDLKRSEPHECQSR